MITLKELASREDLFEAGHTLCPGCVIPVILKLVLRSSQQPFVISNASGCLQKGSSCFPHTSWKSNWIHSSYGNASATMSGIIVMHRSLKKQGKLPVQKELKFLVIGGDGATYDSGLGSLSGAMERREDIVYLCYDNQLSANTGGQSTSATPMGASTPTTPASEVFPGKLLPKKNISMIIASHKIPYVAQTAPWIWKDLFRKSEKAFELVGPAYLNVLSPCPNHWKISPEKSIEITKLAADTCIWPIFEIKDGIKITVNYKPKQKRPVTDWFQSQKRFQHLLDQENKWIVNKIQEEVDKEWDLLISSENKNDEKMRDN